MKATVSFCFISDNIILYLAISFDGDDDETRAIYLDGSFTDCCGM
jgi:hypothetical protein